MLLGNFNEQVGGGVNHHHQSTTLTSLPSLDDVGPPDPTINLSAYVAHNLNAKSQLGPGKGVYYRFRDSVSKFRVEFFYGFEIKPIGRRSDLQPEFSGK